MSSGRGSFSSGTTHCQVRQVRNPLCSESCTVVLEKLLKVEPRRADLTRPSAVIAMLRLLLALYPLLLVLSMIFGLASMDISS